MVFKNCLSGMGVDVSIVGENQSWSGKNHNRTNSAPSTYKMNPANPDETQTQSDSFKRLKQNPSNDSFLGNDPTAVADLSRSDALLKSIQNNRPDLSSDIPYKLPGQSTEYKQFPETDHSRFNFDDSRNPNLMAFPLEGMALRPDSLAMGGYDHLLSRNPIGMNNYDNSRNMMPSDSNGYDNMPTRNPMGMSYDSIRENTTSNPMGMSYDNNNNHTPTTMQSPYDNFSPRIETQMPIQGYELQQTEPQIQRQFQDVLNPTDQLEALVSQYPILDGF